MVDNMQDQSPPPILQNLPNLQTLARALGGEVSNGQVLSPGPGHSPVDRSLAVRPDPNAPDGFVVHSFANDDPIACKDYVREKCRLPAFKRRTNDRKRASGDEIAALLASAVESQHGERKIGRFVAAYQYTDEEGALLYEVVRFEPKTFRQRRPDGNGDWTWNVNDV